MKNLLLAMVLVAFSACDGSGLTVGDGAGEPAVEAPATAACSAPVRLYVTVNPCWYRLTTPSCDDVAWYVDGNLQSPGSFDVVCAGGVIGSRDPTTCAALGAGATSDVIVGCANPPEYLP